MKVSVELTLSPLSNDFESVIQTYIRGLRASGLKIIETPLSTQVYGDYNEVISLINELNKTVFAEKNNILLNLKIVKGDLSFYEPFN